MSVSCQYDILKYPFFLPDFERIVSIEGEVGLPENLPPIEKIVWGNFEAGAPGITVYDDLLVISGRVYPNLMYLAEPGEYQTRNTDPGADSDETREGEIQRRDYGVHWVNESGVPYEERITVAGLRPGMVVDLNLSPVDAVFEQISPGQIRFHGQMEATAHVAENQADQVVSEVVAQLPAKVNTSKESVRVEEFQDIRKETIPIQASLMLSNLKPGAARVLTYLARPMGVNWETVRGRIFIRGFLEISMVYVGCDDEGRPTEVFAHEWTRASGTAIPFEMAVNFDSDDTDLVIIPRVNLQNSTLEMRTPREMRYRADLNCEVMISKIVPKDVVVDVTSGGDQVIDSQKYLLNFEEYLGEKTGEINLDLPLSLPGGETPERLLVWEGSPKGISLETAEGKVLVEGNLDLRLIYTSDSPDGGKVQVTSWDRQNNNGLPLAGMVEFPGLQPEALLRAQVQLESLNMELTEDRNIRVTATAKVRIIARAPRALMALRDCAAVEPIDPSTRPSMLFYVVQPGDSLWKIARQYQTTVDTLARVNQITSPDRIDTGRKLFIPKQVG